MPRRRGVRGGPATDGSGSTRAAAPRAGRGLRGAGILTLVAGLAACDARPAEPAPPTLVVLIAVDGLRADLLDRYDEAFRGGLRRLRDEGRRFDQAWVDHAITVSHAGHVSLATGRLPSQHGIVDAAFYVPDGQGRTLVDAVADSSESVLGVPGPVGASPKRVIGDGLAEWVLGADPEARALAVGSGDISSLLYTFHAPADAYWYRGGRYVTSTYYRSSYPGWVERFNRDRLPAAMQEAKRWTTHVPASLRHLAREDSAAYEGDKRHTAFPHVFEEELADAIARDADRALATWFGWTPSLDEATLALARRGVHEMELGRRGATDVLTIVLSMVDSNSHYYGPLSLETFDTLIRLDAALGAFFGDLDETVGRDAWVVALSADHGFPEVPEYRLAQGLPAARIRAGSIDSLFQAVRSGSDSSAAPDARAREVALLAESAPFVAEAFTPRELAGLQGTDSPFLALYRNSFRPDRVPRLPLFSLRTFDTPLGEAGVMVRLTEGAIIDIDVDTHGSPYAYDRHVPLVVLGPGIGAGLERRPVRTVDVAPTLARIAGVPVPSGLDGRPLLPGVDRERQR